MCTDTISSTAGLLMTSYSVLTPVLPVFLYLVQGDWISLWIFSATDDYFVAQSESSFHVMFLGPRNQIQPCEYLAATRRHTRMHARTHARAHARTHASTHARTHTPPHTHACTHAHTHTLLTLHSSFDYKQTSLVGINFPSRSVILNNLANVLT